MDSQRRSACYPRRTFYPFSNGPSIQNHWITKSCFRTCSTCMSRRQASFCLYALPTISIRHEETRTPPLHFRRRPPQSNYPPDTVFIPDYGIELDLQTNKGGISRLTP